MSPTIRSGFVFLALCLAAAATRAEDAFYDISAGDLKLIESKWPEFKNEYGSGRHFIRMEAIVPYAVVDGPGEAVLSGPGSAGGAYSYFGPNVANQPVNNRIHLRGPQGQDIHGQVIVPNSDKSKMAVLKFTVPASTATAEAKQAFYRAKIGRYQAMLNRDMPGGAWYRHEIHRIETELKQPNTPLPEQVAPRTRFSDDLSSSYDLFSGGRAISENLQLNRAMLQRGEDQTSVKIDSLKGITINEIDWKPLIKDAHPSLDPLAKKIPADQHAVFFASFQAALAVADETKQHDTPIMQMAQPRSEDEKVIERYQRQFGLPMSTLARLLGPTVVKSVALTGSDGSFPTGTDIAVLFETDQPMVLANILTTRIAMAAAEVKDVKMMREKIDGLTCQSFVSPNRVMSSYLAQLDGAVVVANSKYQIQRIAAVAHDKTPSLASLPEFIYFRNRYPRADADETAFIFLSDATIRRWCGPKWRIGESRRTRARAVLAELQASQLDDLVRRNVEPGILHTDLPILGGGKLRVTPAGVTSSEYGSLAFLTPVSEMTFDEVTKTEADAYTLWRDGYQRNWSWGFDPIGLRITLNKQKAAADLTVMPLIVNSDYQRFISISQGGTFGPKAGDPHNALVHFIMAINRESEWFKYGEHTAANLGQTISLGWMGPSIAVFVDDDPLWQDLAKVKEEEIDKFMTKNLGRLPVGVRIESTNPLKLAAFLTTARTFIEQTGPGLTKWEPLKYHDISYVRISPVKGESIPNDFANLSIYYTSVGGALTITLSEKVLHNVIDRFQTRQAQAAEGEASQNKTAQSVTAKPAEAKAVVAQTPWPGTNVALHVDHRILELGNVLGREQYEQQMQLRSWRNLPILNEWKRLYPDRDPVEVHRQVWGVELICPGSGKYVWNEKYHTMESSVYGHPGEPKAGPPAPPVLSSFTSADFGLTLEKAGENEGLRSRVELQRGKK